MCRKLVVTNEIFLGTRVTCYESFTKEEKLELKKTDYLSWKSNGMNINLQIVIRCKSKIREQIICRI